MGSMGKIELDPGARISMAIQIVSSTPEIQDYLVNLYNSDPEAARAWVTESYGIDQGDVDACFEWMTAANGIDEAMLWRWW